MTVREILAPPKSKEDEKQHYFILNDFLDVLEKQHREAAEDKNFKRWNRVMNMITLVQGMLDAHPYIDRCFMCKDTSNVVANVDGSQACKECKVWWYKNLS
jgi:hypothetical protein